MPLLLAAAGAAAAAAVSAATWLGLDGGTIISRSDVLRGQCWDLAAADDSHSTRGGSVQGAGAKKRKLDKQIAKCASPRPPPALGPVCPVPALPHPRSRSTCQVHQVDHLRAERGAAGAALRGRLPG